MNKSKTIHELLLPAGNIEKAKYAINYGADAIYIGPKAYSLRARSSNFDIKEIKEITEYAHNKNKKVYIALNIICHNADVRNFKNYFSQIIDTKIDGIIVADPFILKTIREMNANIELHVSTQQSINNSKACKFFQKNGATRIILGREVSYEELKELLKNVSVEIEYFIHGAVCISYSGRCMMSNNFSLRDANVGGCAQSCRWKYKIVNQELKDLSDKYFTMSPKDMELLYYFDKLLELDIAAFKVEGRMKSIHYVATVANCYRYFIDNYKNNKIVDKDIIKNDLEKAENRLADCAWFNGTPDTKKMLYFELEKNISQIFAFNFEQQIDDYTFIIKSRNYFSKNTPIEIMYLDFKRQAVTIEKIWDNEGNEIDVVKNPMHLFKIKFNQPIKFNKYLIARVLNLNQDN
ncbi:MAG: U32 family peptidase [Malacoplasma sp.]|nr:U32 family peptidase [Malacoplasma sp.]